jgi:hypothetical protein
VSVRVSDIDTAGELGVDPWFGLLEITSPHDAVRQYRIGPATPGVLEEAAHARPGQESATP